MQQKVKNFDLQNFLKNLYFVCLPAFQPAIRLKCNIYTTKAITLDLQNCCSYKSLFNVPMCFLLLSFRLQIAYRKVRNLEIGVDKLVGKVSINLLCHAKVSACIINIIIIIDALSYTIDYY